MTPRKLFKFQFHKGTIRTKLTHFTQMMAWFTTRYCQAYTS